MILHYMYILLTLYDVGRFDQNLQISPHQVHIFGLLAWKAKMSTIPFPDEMLGWIVSLVFSSLYVIFIPEVLSFLSLQPTYSEMEALEVCRSDLLAQKHVTSRLAQHFLERGVGWARDGPAVVACRKRIPPDIRNRFVG